MSEGATVGTLQTFKATADNPLTRNVLKTLSKNCRKDSDTRLELRLNSMWTLEKNACLSCRSRALCQSDFF
jgi:hypothetical protein